MTSIAHVARAYRSLCPRPPGGLGCAGCFPVQVAGGKAVARVAASAAAAGLIIRLASIRLAINVPSRLTSMPREDEGIEQIPFFPILNPEPIRRRTTSNPFADRTLTASRTEVR